MHAIPYTLVALSTLLLSTIASSTPTEELFLSCGGGLPCRNGQCYDGSPCTYESGVPKGPNRDGAASSSDDLPTCGDGSYCQRGYCPDGSPCGVDNDRKPSSNVAGPSSEILFCSDGWLCQEGKCHTSGAPCEGFTYDPTHPTAEVKQNQPQCEDTNPRTNASYAIPEGFKTMQSYCVGKLMTMCTGSGITWPEALSGGSGNPDNCGNSCKCGTDVKCPVNPIDCKDPTCKGIDAGNGWGTCNRLPSDYLNPGSQLGGCVCKASAK